MRLEEGVCVVRETAGLKNETVISVRKQIRKHTSAMSLNKVG